MSPSINDIVLLDTITIRHLVILVDSVVLNDPHFSPDLPRAQLLTAGNQVEITA